MSSDEQKPRYGEMFRHPVMGPEPIPMDEVPADHPLASLIRPRAALQGDDSHAPAREDAPARPPADQD